MNISMAFFAQWDHIKIVFPFLTKIMMVFFRLIFAKSTNKCLVEYTSNYSMKHGITQEGV